MKIVLIYLIIGFSIQQIYPQIEPEWVIRHAGQYWPDIGYDVATDKSDNVYVTGEKMTQTTSTDIIILKYNSDGVEQWVRNYDGTGNWSDKPIAITIDENDDIYVLGRSMINNWNPYETDYVTIKFNSNGVQQWAKTYNGPGNYTDEPSAMKIDNSGNIVVTGSSYRYYDSTNSYEKIDFATIKYNANGDELWIRRYELQNGRSGAAGVTVDRFDNVYVTGSIILDNQSGDYLTLKYDPDGNLIWARSYNGLYSGNDAASFIDVDTNDNVYVTGVSVESQTLETITTIKYNSSGVEQWIKNLQLPPNNTRAIPRSMKVSEDGNIIITGLILTNNMLVTLKYNTEGELVWINTHPGASPGYRHSVKFDSWGNVYVAGNKANDFTTIKYDKNGNEKWIHTYNGPANGVDAATSLSIDKNGDVYVTGFSTGLGTGVDITTIKYPGKRYPVFIVPGIAGTYSSSTSADLSWILTRGVPPVELQIDPLGKVYNDIIETFVNVGYKKDTTLFVVNYDWRLTPGPIDNSIDGKIDGLSGVSITDNQFNYGVDYLGWYIKKACEIWREKYDEDLDSIDIIAHSTGGLVSRTYLQSDAYGDLYDLANNYKLPRIRNLIMIGVPNRGASKAWNALNDNWIADIVYRFVLSKILNRAYQKVLQDNAIQGPDTVITQISIQDSSGNPSKTKFISLYVPTIRGLLATYNFIDLGSGYVNVNNDPDKRNTFLLDLNDGLDLNSSADANKFLDSARVFVIHGTGEKTKDLVQQRSDFELLALQSFTDWTPSNASSGTIWYKDLEADQNGDKTVPTISSAGQFQNDNRATLIPFNTGDHTALVSKIEVQSNILDILNVAYESNDISTGSSASFSNVWNVISDPVDLILLDGNGNRLGYTTPTGALTEIPNSIWFGNTDGMGYIFGSVTEPVNLQLTGLGEDYYVMVSVEDSGRYGGVVLEGFLAQGEVISYQIKLDPLSIEQLTLTADDFTLAQNYPNPFNPVTTIQYSISQRSDVTLKVYDVLGNEIAILVNEEKEKGVYSVNFDASALSSGIYFYRLQAGSYIDTKKMILLR